MLPAKRKQVENAARVVLCGGFRGNVHSEQRKYSNDRGLRIAGTRNERLGRFACRMQSVSTERPRRHPNLPLSKTDERSSFSRASKNGPTFAKHLHASSVTGVFWVIP